jgi:cytochrome oxidase Cu insertion factor (SCO1/SenC/PrrC family)
MSRRVLAALAGAFVLIGLAAVAMLPQMAARHTDQITIGGPFNLIDGHGKTVSNTDFRGKYMLVYFGYTHCPDACPTMLSDMASAIDKLPAADRAKLVPIFITVDPDRDTPSMIGDYAGAFGPSFVGLTGSQAEITKAEDAYHVYARKHPLKNGDYAMDHSSILYVMGPDGVYRGVIEDNTKPSVMAQQMQNLGV